MDVEVNDTGTFGMDEGDLLKLRSYVRPLPLPSYQTPTAGAPLASCSDDLLLNISPQMIGHVQRTAAQGGMQVVSPRQTPFSALMVRTPGAVRQMGDHIVGSIADPNVSWPTLDGGSLEHLLPDEPLPHEPLSAAHRVKTRTTPLTQAAHHLADPILACLVKGRAVIDLLRRDDVMGGADEYTEVLSRAWGIDKADIDDLDAFTLGVDGPLLRHAIKADEVFATYYAPIHVKKCISVGASDVTRHYLPEDSAMDWSRMRTYCEAVFVITCTNEGIPIKYIRSLTPPGDPSALGSRRHVMCFQPAPGTAWTFAPETFSVCPMLQRSAVRPSAIPKDVLRALSRYVEVVRPMSFAMRAGYSARARKTTMTETPGVRDETLTESYRLMVLTISLGSARGKLAASAVRNAIYSALESASPSIRLRIVRYITIAREECRVHLNLREVPDRVIEKLCDRFLKVGELIRLRIVNEAARRNHTADEWWADIASQAPERYRLFSEGTKGWALMGLWLMFRAPTDRWSKLSSALQYSALREAEISAIGSMPLPAKKGSVERLLAAGRIAAKNIAKAYCGFYTGVGDVGMAMSDVALSLGRPRTADILKEAAYLWILRARALRGTNVEVVAKDRPTPSMNHFRIHSQPIDLLVVPAPYRAYEAYKSHAVESPILRPAYKDYLKVAEDVRVSNIFINCEEPPYHTTKTTLTQYMLEPKELGRDMERAWTMLVQDMHKVADTYGAKERSRSPSPSRKKAKIVAQVPIIAQPPKPIVRGTSYWDITADLDIDRVEWVEDVLAKAGTAIEDAFMEKMFANQDEFFRELFEIEAMTPGSSSKPSEVVR